jgi:hypothetical protein
MVLPNMLEPNTEIWLLFFYLKIEIWWLEKKFNTFFSHLKKKTC